MRKLSRENAHGRTYAGSGRGLSGSFEHILRVKHGCLKFKETILKFKSFARPSKNSPIADWAVAMTYGPLIIVLGIPAALIQLVLYPFLIIRTGWHLQGSRLGHLVIESDIYLTDQASRPRRSLDLFGLPGTPANLTIYKEIRRKIHFFPNWIVFPTHMANYILPWGQKFHVPLVGRPTDLRSLDDTPPSLFSNLSYTELTRGNELLMDMGIPPGTPIVCLYIRDGAFSRGLLPDTDNNFANYRDCKIDTYSRAAHYLANRGYAVVRMGREVEETFAPDRPLIVDYATSEHRSDFADVFLSRECTFAVASDSGSSTLPIMFRKPLAICNVGGFHGVLQGKAISIIQLKSFYSTPESRLLTLKELICSGVVDFDSQNQFDYLGIKHIDNSADDLLDLVVDICDLVEGRWQQSAAHEERTKRFQALIEPFRQGGISSHLCRGWARRNDAFFN